jgi:hypothetical protein
MYIQPNPSRSLTYYSTALQHIVDPLDTIVLHAHQEAARHLWV